MRMASRRVLILVHGLQAGGGERQLALMASGLASFGWAVDILTLSPGGPHWDELRKVRGVTLESVDRSGALDFGVLVRCVRHIARHDVAVVQGWMQPCNTFAALAGMMTRRPVVLGVRTISDAVVGFGPRLYLRSEPLLARLSRGTVVCNSLAGLREWQARRPRTRVMHIPNGLVPPPRALPAPIARPRALRIGMLARLDPVKRHDVVLKALAVVRREGVEATFVNWGAETARQRAALERLARELGVSDDVEFHASYGNVWDALGQIDVFVSASRAEGMSNSLMEAMAAGRVIVATDAGDTRDMLSSPEGPCGFAVDGDADGIAGAILHVSANPGLARSYAATAARKAAHAFSVPAMVQAYESVYTSALSHGEAGIAAPPPMR